jgi:hypothetical protein
LKTAQLQLQPIITHFERHQFRTSISPKHFMDKFVIRTPRLKSNPNALGVPSVPPSMPLPSKGVSHPQDARK